MTGAMPTGLVVCSLEPWDEVWRRNQFLVAGLLASDPRLRVLFVEPPTDPAYDLLRRRRPTRARGLRRRADVAEGRLWTYQQTKIAPRRVGPIVDHALSVGVARAARRIDLHRPVLWINDPSRAPLVRRSRGPALYDITDDWLVADRSVHERDRIRANEDELMSRCAAVVVCSPHLQAVKGARRDVELVPNAVDLDRYRTPVPRPRDLPSGRTVVYVGTLHEDRLAVPLCAELAGALGDRAALVFVGPNALSLDNAARLTATANVTMLGARPNRDIPGYLQHADVLVVPHVVTEFTESLDPIKLYEYLAVGRPVVSTPVAGFRAAGPAVHVATADCFAAAVLDRLDVAAQPSGGDAGPVPLPTWADRVAAMRTIIERINSD